MSIYWVLEEQAKMWSVFFFLKKDQAAKQRRFGLFLLKEQGQDVVLELDIF